ncbi:Hypothetical_protein [Hexamita inflata]|uniref:Hypothetical_protein n=1 Tax=Hexamita inflata TaxID=28002 RepID=A0AA86RB58_9EUKA|nr:Hypothetical protein HINF_LOCUS62406 [Hexamita inflata]
MGWNSLEQKCVYYIFYTAVQVIILVTLQVEKKFYQLQLLLHLFFPFYLLQTCVEGSKIKIGEQQEQMNMLEIDTCQDTTLLLQKQKGYTRARSDTQHVSTSNSSQKCISNRLTQKYSVRNRLFQSQFFVSFCKISTCILT